MLAGILLRNIDIGELWFLKRRRFRYKYLKDPLFLVCVAIYFANRFIVEPLTIGRVNFFHCYVNDLICFPFWLPIILFLTRAVGLRGHDDAPDFYELSFYLLLWSYCFEFLGPLYGKYFNYPVADPWDVVCYTLGSMIAGIYWNYEIRRPIR
jgi:hypothetical protein